MDFFFQIQIVNTPPKKHLCHHKPRRSESLYLLSPCRDLLVTLAFGQVLSCLICAIGLTSKYLADDFHANTPVFQSFLNYILLFLVYTTTLAVRQGTHRTCVRWLIENVSWEHLAIPA